MPQSAAQPTTLGEEYGEVDLNRAISHFAGSLTELQESFNLFCDLYPEMIDAIEGTISAQERQKLTRSLHSLKGALSNFFPRSLISQLQVLENSSHSGSDEYLRDEWDRIHNQLKSFVKDMSTAIARIHPPRNTQ